MTGLIILAETPRAGELGHRFLSPNGCPASEGEIAAFIRAADSDISIGENFIAMSRHVPQSVSAGSMRMGREVIVLVGVDVSRISSHTLALILRFLQVCFAKLEPLLRGGIDWNQRSHADIIVKRPELDAWLDDLSDVSVATTEWRGGPRQLRAAGPISQPTSGTIRGKPWRTIATVCLAFALGSAAGAVVVRYCPGSGAVDQRNLISVGAPATPITQPNDGIPHPSIQDGKRTPGDGVSNASRGVSDLLHKAVGAGKVDIVIDVIPLLPNNPNVLIQERQVLVDYCKKLAGETRFEESAKVASQLITHHKSLSLDAEQIALLNDLQRQAEENRESIDQQDRRLYESIRESTGKQQAAAAKSYLELAPRQIMSPVVKQWLDCIESTVDVEVIGINVPSGGSSIIRFVANGREIAVRVESSNRVGRSAPVVFRLAHLGITVRDLPAMVTVSVDREPITPLHASPRYSGEMVVRRHPIRETRVEVQLTGPPLQEGSMAVRVPAINAIPRLPNWKKDLP